MRGLAPARDVHMAQVAVNARHDTHRQPARFEHGPLLDMHFDERRDRAWGEQLFAAGDRRHVGSDVIEVGA